MNLVLGECFGLLHSASVCGLEYAVPRACGWLHLVSICTQCLHKMYCIADVCE